MGDIRFKIVGYTDNDVSNVNNAQGKIKVTNSGTIGYRQNGRTVGWNGGSSYYTGEKIGTNIVQMQGEFSTKNQSFSTKQWLKTKLHLIMDRIPLSGGAELGTTIGLMCQGETDVYKASLSANNGWAC